MAHGAFGGDAARNDTSCVLVVLLSRTPYHAIPYYKFLISLEPSKLLASYYYSSLTQFARFEMHVLKCLS